MLHAVFKKSSALKQEPQKQHKILHYEYHSKEEKKDTVKVTCPMSGIMTRYGLDGPGIESQWKQDFTHTSRLALATTQPPRQ